LILDPSHNIALVGQRDPMISLFIKINKIRVTRNPADQIPRSAISLVGVLPTNAHHKARIAALTARLRAPVLLQTVLTRVSMQSIKEMSKNNRRNTTKVGERPSLLEKNMANSRIDFSIRAKDLNTAAQSPISSKFQEITSRTPLGELPANVGEDLDGPGDDLNGCVLKELDSIISMRSESAASCV
jgi:hypothetical protein